MKRRTLEVLLEGRPATLQLEREGEMWRFSLCGPDGETRRYKASLVAVGSGIYSVLLEGRSFEIRVSGEESDMSVEVNGRRLGVQVRDPRDLAVQGEAQASEDRVRITTPMPGKVVRVMVREGETVVAGQGLVVVEAMKMQNEMKTPKAGRVISVRVSASATVNAGDVLAVVE